ncbi:hypothetical protein TrRE_jg8418, partial [Triparma retinervis]
THIITSLLDLSPKVDWQRKTEALDKFSAAYTSSSLRVSSSEMAQLNVFFSVCLGDLRSSLIRSALDCLVNITLHNPSNTTLLLTLLTPSFINLLSQTVKVIQVMTVQSVKSLMQHCKFTKCVPLFVEAAVRREQKSCRSWCFVLLHHALLNFPEATFESSSFLKACARGMEDPAQQVRMEARKVYDAMQEGGKRGVRGMVSNARLRTILESKGAAKAQPAKGVGVGGNKGKGSTADGMKMRRTSLGGTALKTLVTKGTVMKDMRDRRKSCVGVLPLPITPERKEEKGKFSPFPVVEEKKLGDSFGGGEGREQERQKGGKQRPKRPPKPEAPRSGARGEAAKAKAPPSAAAIEKVYKAHKVAIDELMQTLQEEMTLISGVDGREKDGEYLEAVKVCLEARRDIDEKLLEKVERLL